MKSFFSKTKTLESKIEEFLDHTSAVSLLFVEAVKDYVEGRQDEFESRRQQVSDLEKQADRLRLEVERQLYVETLIPESRGDVLGLLEHTDGVVNDAKSALMQISVERPAIPDELKPRYVELADYCSRAVGELVTGVRCFFRSASIVSDYVHKVSFWEEEADKVAERLKRRIFEMDIDLCLRIQLGQFVAHIDAVADQAEDVAERLTISAIKRSI
jgi:predicted phosphate transport protein (TIGR00153 family)